MLIGRNEKDPVLKADVNIFTTTADDSNKG